MKMSKSAYEKFKRGEQLTRKQAMGAQCYECNGYDIELAHDCSGNNCPLYQWSPWGLSRGLRPVNALRDTYKRRTEVKGKGE